MPGLTRYISAFAVGAALALSTISAGPVRAAGTEDGSSGGASAATYDQAKAAVAAGKFAEARAMLVDITAAEPKNADAWNLLGFSSRKSGDLRAAGKAYAKALKLNPGHLGALEYQGEMFVQMGEAEKAKANLEKLKSLCGNCEEMQDLQKALKSAGLI